MPACPVPRAYFFFAALCLATAGLVMAITPHQLTGFFYHPKLLAVVHLLTLGWITGALLARFEGVRLRYRPVATQDSRWGERGAFVVFVLGTTGVMSHFWIGEMSGVGLSGILVAFTILRLGARGLAELHGADLSDGFVAGCLLAFGNLAAAVVLGMLIALDRYVDVLGGFVLHHVYAHAHLAALGWAAMLWLTLTATRDAPRSLGRLLIFEVGILALTTSLFLGGTNGAWHFPLAVALALAGCLVVGRGPWPRPAPFEIRFALGSWIVAGVLGLVIAVHDPGDLVLRLIPAYGGLALLGFLSAGIAVLDHKAPRTDGLDRSRKLGWILASLLIPLAFALDQPPLLRLGGFALVWTAVGEGLAHRRQAQDSMSTSVPSAPTP